MAFGFGLVHGFGFSFALQNTLQFAGAHVLTSLLSFNVGIELGQLLVLVLLVPALNLVFRIVDARVGGIVLAVIVGHTAWHWLGERLAALRSFDSFGLRRRLVELNQIAAGVDEIGNRQGPICFGALVNSTPCRLSRSNSAWTSSTSNAVAGIPCASSAC